MASFVDPISNTVVISHVNLRRDLTDLIKLKFPESWLPTFLHEATHHACFLSPVGTTLALLRMRAYRRATDLRADKPYMSEWDLLEDVLRQEATMEMLRPLSEGLACFSELDSTPGESNVLTAPMASVLMHFGESDDKYKTASAHAGDWPNRYLSTLLCRTRLTDQSVRRREAVLSAKFISAFGGHLAGYMGIKALWQDAKRKSNLAWDAELFSAYVRSYFFDDYGFVATILDTVKSEHNSVNAVASYFQGRVNELIDTDWESALRDYTRTHRETVFHHGLTGPRLHPNPLGIYTDNSLHDLGMSRLDSLVSEVESDDRTDVTEWCMRRFDLARLQKRELLCLGSLDASVEVNDARRLLVYSADGEGKAEWPTFAGGVPDGVQEGEAKGSIEFYLIPAERSSALVVIRRTEVVYVEFQGPIEESRRQQLSKLFGTRSQDLRILEEQEGNLEHVIANGVIGVVRDQARESIPKGVDHLYSWLATINVPDSQKETTSQMLLVSDLVGLCEEDDEFLYGLAFLGNANSLTCLKSDLTTLAADRDIDVDSVCRKADSLRASTGLSTIVDSEGVLVAVL